MKRIEFPLNPDSPGASVVNLQVGLRLLIAQGGLTVPPAFESGLMSEQNSKTYGEKTLNLVAQFQQVNQLPITGTVDGPTSGRLNFALRKFGVFPLRVVTSIDATTSLEDIGNFQECFLRLLESDALFDDAATRGDLISRITEDLMNSRFGQGTAQAINSFQTSRGITLTGLFRFPDDKTVDQLNVAALRAGLFTNPRLSALFIAIPDLGLDPASQTQLRTTLESFESQQMDLREFWHQVDSGTIPLSQTIVDQLPILRYVDEVGKYLDYDLNAVRFLRSSGRPLAGNVRNLVFGMMNQKAILFEALGGLNEGNDAKKTQIQQLANSARQRLLRDYATAAKLRGVCDLCGFNPFFTIGNVENPPVTKATLSFLYQAVTVGKNGNYFDFATSKAADFAKLLPTDAGTRAKVIDEVKLLKNLALVCPSESLAPLLQTRFRSATDIVRRSRKSFLVETQDLLGGRETADEIYRRAVALCSAHLTAALHANQEVAADRPGFVPSTSKELPTWAKLFGPSGQCACGQCRSIASPAAYFVDLLNFLDGCGNPQESVLKLLLKVRPDLEHLKLSCQNTETEIPYIDLANEILESFVVHNRLESSANNVNSETSEELVAEPQHVSEEAYKILATSVYPIRLPYDRWGHLTRELLAQRGVHVADLLTALLTDRQIDADLPTRFQGASDLLEIAEREFAILTGINWDGSPITISTAALWGCSETLTEPIASEISTVADVLGRLAISYDQLRSLLNTRFVNPVPQRGGAPGIVIGPPEACDTALMNLSHRDGTNGSLLSDQELRKFVVFVRLWRHLPWTFDELDRACDAFNVTNAITAEVIEKVALVEQLRRSTGIGVVPLLGLWRETVDAVGANSLYARVFQDRLQLPASALADASLKLSSKADAIAAAVGLRIDELLRLQPTASATLSLNLLATIYRNALLSRLLQITVTELSLIRKLSVIDPLTGPRETLRFIQQLADLRSRNWTLTEVAFQCGLDVPETASAKQSINDAKRLLLELEPFQALRAAADAKNIAVTDAEVSDDNLRNVLMSVMEVKDPLTTVALVAGRKPPQFSATDELRFKELRKQLIDKKLIDETLELFVEPINKAKSDQRIQQVLVRLKTQSQNRELQRLTAQVVDRIRAVGAIEPSLFDAVQGLNEFQAFLGPQLSDTERELAALRFVRIYRLILSLRLNAEEISLFLEPQPRLKLPGLRALATGTLNVRDSFALLLQSARLVLLRERSLPKDVSLRQIATAGDLDRSPLVCQLLGVRELEQPLVARLWPVPATESPAIDEVLARLDRLRRLCQQIQITPSRLLELIGVGADSSQERATRLEALLREQQSQSAWLQVIKPISDRVREAGRNALLSVVVNRLALTNRNEVFDRLLIDAEMNSFMRTSRLKQAIATVQLFVQRCLLDLVREVPPATIDTEQWENRKNYRTWEANRLVTLYPENWLQPSLRDDKSPAFRELEAQLLQGSVTSGMAESALQEYCEKLDAVGRLEINGVCWDQHAEVLHAFGRTCRGVPRRYYHRTLRQSEWSAWELIDVEITGIERDESNPSSGIHLLPLIWKGRLQIFWLTEMRKVQPPPVGLPSHIAFKGGAVLANDFSVDTPTVAPELRLASSTLSATGWTPKQLLGDGFQQLRQDRLSDYRLRYVENQGQLTIGVFQNSSAVAQIAFRDQDSAWIVPTTPAPPASNFPFNINGHDFSRLRDFPRQTIVADNSPRGLQTATTGGLTFFLQANEPSDSHGSTIRLTQTAEVLPVDAQALTGAIGTAAATNLFPALRHFVASTQNDDLWCEFRNDHYDHLAVRPFAHGQTGVFLERFHSGGLDALFHPKAQTLGNKYLVDDWNRQEQFTDVNDWDITFREVTTNDPIDPISFLGLATGGGELTLLHGTMEAGSRKIRWIKTSSVPGFVGARQCDFVLSSVGTTTVVEILVPLGRQLVHVRRSIVSDSGLPIQFKNDPTIDQRFTVRQAEGSEESGDSACEGSVSVVKNGDQLLAAVRVSGGNLFMYAFNGREWRRGELISSWATNSPALAVANVFVPTQRNELHLIVPEGTELVHYRCRNANLREWERFAVVAVGNFGSAAITVKNFDSPYLDLHLIVPEAHGYRHYYLNSMLSPPRWTRGPLVSSRRKVSLAGQTTIPSLFLGNDANFGSLQLFVSEPNGFVHYDHVESHPEGDMSRRYNIQQSSTDILSSVGAMDFSAAAPYAVYNWELFFHIPLLVAIRLSQNKQFADAQRWFHFVFDPTRDSAEGLSERVWRFQPFRDGNSLGTGSAPNDPDLTFQPHRIARGRLSAYQKWVVMKYLDNLIAWGDSAFAKETIESINEATQLYLLADRILGARPQRITPQIVPPTKTYAELMNTSTDGLSDAIASQPLSANSDLLSTASLFVGIENAATAFCIPPNDELLNYWSLVEDRLFKIRNSMNENGIIRQLPLFEAPLNPALFIEARALGLDPSKVFDDIQVPLYRFTTLFQRAIDACNELRSLGNALVTALEKKDAEALTKIRAEQELAFLTLTRENKQWQWREALESIKTLEASRESAIVRLRHYAASLGENISSIPSSPTGPESPSDPRESLLKSVADYVPKGNFRLVDASQSTAFNSLAISGAELGQQAAEEVQHAKAAMIKYLGSLLKLAILAPLQGGGMAPGLSLGGSGSGIGLAGAIAGGPVGAVLAASQIPGVKDTVGDIPVVGDVLTSGIDKVSDLGDQAKKIPVIGGLFGGADDSPLSVLADPTKLISGFVSTAIENLLPQALKPLDPIFDEASRFLGVSFDTVIGNVQRTNEITSSNTKVLHFEEQELSQMRTATEFNIKSSYAEKVASILGTMPSFSINISPFGIGMSTASPPLAAAASAVARGNAAEGAWHSFQSSLAARMASFVWREREFALQRNLAGREIAQIDRQIVVAKIRERIARREIEHHDAQIRNSQKIDDFLRTKYTRQELYSVMEQKLSDLYLRTYRLARDLARQAERCFRFELNEEFRLENVLPGEIWESQHNGLFAGERLYHALRQMEKAYLDRNRRTLEITKHVSLLQIAPLALVSLRKTGECQFDVPEVLFDMDFLGHYLRRLRTVSMTIPCVVGPYVGINAELSLVNCRTRVRDDASPYAETPEWGDNRFEYHFGGPSSIAVSHGQNDSGLFELNFRDERYLPFEGAGAISRWNLRLVNQIRSFDYDSIADVILHLRISSQQGSNLFRSAAKDHLTAALSTAANQRLFSIRQEFSKEWANFKFVKSESGRSKLSLTFSDGHFPFWSKGRSNAITSVRLLAAGNRTISVFYNSAPHAAEPSDTLSQKTLPGLVESPLDHLQGPFRFTDTITLFFDDNSISDLFLIMTWSTPAPI